MYNYKEIKNKNSIRLSKINQKKKKTKDKVDANKISNNRKSILIKYLSFTIACY